MFVIGKPYDIDYVIQELRKAPDIRLGHIVIAMTHEHKYHVTLPQLEEISKKIKKKIAEGGKEYERIGKKFVPLTDITILSIIDPYAIYEKYYKFYMALEPQITKGIEESKRASVAAPTDAVINEAKKMGLILESTKEEREFLEGMALFFKRIGITASPVSGGRYILFEKVAEPSQVVYTKFYDDFLWHVTQGIATSKKGEIAAPITAIIDEAQKLGYIIVGKEKDFLREMELYFKIRGIKTGKIDEKYMVFRK